jgi:hypothetical protein
MSSDLTKDEELEYYRQVRVFGNARFHEHPKCGEPLIPYDYKKRHTRYRRQFCPVHKVIVNMSGWEIGFDQNGALRELNKQQ